MNKILLLLRHGKSDWNADYATDFERPLNNRGKRDADHKNRVREQFFYDTHIEKCTCHGEVGEPVVTWQIFSEQMVEKIKSNSGKLAFIDPVISTVKYTFSLANSGPANVQARKNCIKNNAR